jgi:hypothetical protein
MTKKLIAFSFEPESIGGFAIISNGVHFGRNGAFSHCIPMTKEAFLAACKDRMKFNELLGIDIREGWQNALKDAMEPFTTMKEECDPELASKTIADLDLNIRGEEAVTADMETLEADNAKLVTEVEKEVKKETKPKKTTKKAKKEVKNDERRDDTVTPVSENDGCAEGDGISAEGTSTADNA